ncbi:hypothetical protein AB4099_24500 [Bosea sp. 2KB_26]|uniref:hypothetical protein n=1 Tax=Bosea sp. 2KB_26 TaxID=3237475 RepID=UPI003F8D9BE9
MTIPEIRHLPYFDMVGAGISTESSRRRRESASGGACRQPLISDSVAARCLHARQQDADEGDELWLGQDEADPADRARVGWTRPTGSRSAGPGPGNKA